MSEKRKRNKNERPDRKFEQGQQTGCPMVDESSPIVQMFRCFQQELDQRYDKYERLVKLSRDITIESKRVIFLLHRVKNLLESKDILDQAEEKLLSLESTKLKEVAKELFGTDPFQFIRAVSPGLQEYIEAVTFFYFLKDNCLVPLSAVQARLVFPASRQTGNLVDQHESDKIADNENQENINLLDVSMDSDAAISVVIAPTEYFLGIADLTGELMRRAINSVGEGDLGCPFAICTFLQEIEAACSLVGNACWELNKKMFTMRQSLKKVEMACYTLHVRGFEIPKHMLVDMISTPVTQFDDECIVESY